MNEKFEQPIEPEKVEKEMSTSEVEQLGDEMEEYYFELKKRVGEIRREMETIGINERKKKELYEEKEFILEQLGEEWEEFIDDIKDGCEVRIDIEKDK